MVTSLYDCNIFERDTKQHLINQAINNSQTLRAYILSLFETKLQKLSVEKLLYVLVSFILFFCFLILDVPHTYPAIRGAVRGGNVHARLVGTDPPEIQSSLGDTSHTVWWGRYPGIVDYI